jgi:hypothetical protein
MAAAPNDAPKLSRYAAITCGSVTVCQKRAPPSVAERRKIVDSGIRTISVR